MTTLRVDPAVDEPAVTGGGRSVDRARLRHPSRPAGRAFRAGAAVITVAV
jgi:hypothetical protein